MPGRQSTDSNLLSTELAKRCEKSTWSTARTLTAKCLEVVNAERLLEVLMIDQRTSGGFMDSDENELAVTPNAWPP
jgi:hypothetical protein